jgi:hypothetical protein
MSAHLSAYTVGTFMSVTVHAYKYIVYKVYKMYVHTYIFILVYNSIILILCVFQTVLIISGSWFGYISHVHTLISLHKVYADRYNVCVISISNAC